MKIAILIIFISCEDKDTIELKESVLSASVSFAYNDVVLQDFFEDPTKATVSGYFYFEDSLASDVIFGLDIEWFEGVENPIHFEGADWMAFVGITREGVVWIPTGLPENLTGIPTQDNWTIRNLNQVLTPNSWYKMTIVANFDTLKFESVSIEGSAMNAQLDLSDIALQYPNYASFDKPTLTFYTFSARSNNLASSSFISDDSKVYFDDIEGTISKDGTYEMVFQNGFENQLEILDIPISSDVISLGVIEESKWYFENTDAKIYITSEVKRTGNYAMVCSADLRF